MHPNDHVNASQSSNDVFPSAIALAATRLLARSLIPALEHLAAVFEAKAAEFAAVVKVGRTHLMDAVPVTLGQEFGGYGAAIRHCASGPWLSSPASVSCRWAGPRPGPG